MAVFLGEISLQWQIREECQACFLVMAQILLQQSPFMHIQRKLQGLTRKTNEYKESFIVYFHTGETDSRRLFVFRFPDSSGKCYFPIPSGNSDFSVFQTTNWWDHVTIFPRPYFNQPLNVLPSPCLKKRRESHQQLQGKSLSFWEFVPTCSQVS